MQQLEDKTKQLYIKMAIQGQEFVKSKLEQKFPKPQYLVLDLHELIELDYGVYDLKANSFKELHEVKTTTKQKIDEFNAGSQLQLECFSIQNYKRKKGYRYVPFYIDVVMISKEIFQTGEFKVLEHRVYTMEKICPLYPFGEKKAMWRIGD